MEPDRQALRQFIERVHGPEPTGWLIVWTRQDKATRAFDLAEEGAVSADRLAVAMSKLGIDPEVEPSWSR